MNIKRLIITIAAVAAICSTAGAQLLWKITPAGADNPVSYLMGTHHVAPSWLIDSIPGLTEAIADVSKVYGEMDMSQAQGPETQQLIMAAGMAPADSLLTMVLTPAQIDSANIVLRKYMGPMADISQMAPLKPAMVSTVLAMMQAQRQFPDFNPAQQLDSEIQRRAAAQGKAIGGFETAAEQAALLFGAPITEQAADLMDAVRNDDKALENSKRLADAYMAGDLEKMLLIMEDPENGLADASERLINARNRNWMNILAGELPSSATLIVVGAGHLPGRDGLISLLRRNGFSVEPAK